MGGVGSRSRRGGGRPNWGGTPNRKTMVTSMLSASGTTTTALSSSSTSARSRRRRRPRRPPRRRPRLRRRKAFSTSTTTPTQAPTLPTVGLAAAFRTMMPATWTQRSGGRSSHGSMRTCYRSTLWTPPTRRSCLVLATWLLMLRQHPLSRLLMTVPGGDPLGARA